MAQELPPTITQLEFEQRDHSTAQAIARKVGYTSFVYTSTSGLWGLFCQRSNPEYARQGEKSDYSGVIIKTKEFGFLLIHDTEDLHLGNLYGIRKGKRRA